MRYLILIEPGSDSTAYSVVVPDLPGCYSAGDTLDEAIENAEEAILMHLEALIDAGESLPEPSSIDRQLKDPAYKDWIRAMVDIDMSRIHGPAQRINITIPKRVLRAIDAAAARAHETRSGFLARAGLKAAQLQDMEKTTGKE